jgi:hypothetical protein
MKKTVASVLLLATVSSQAFAAQPDSRRLRQGIQYAKSQINTWLSQHVSEDEDDAAIRGFLTKSSLIFEQAEDSLDKGDTAKANNDNEGFLNNFAVGCVQVASARAQINNAGRTSARDASAGLVPFISKAQTDGLVTNVTDTRDSAGCPH